MTRSTGYDTQGSIQSFLSCLTCAGDSISSVSWFTCTFEAAYSVIAGGIRATSSVLCFTFVDICVVTDQQTQLHDTTRYDVYEVNVRLEFGR